jgi:hypothetical protein
MPGVSLLVALGLASAAAPATDACVARAGTVTGEGSTLPVALAGADFKKSHAIKRPRTGAPSSSKGAISLPMTFARQSSIMSVFAV